MDKPDQWPARRRGAGDALAYPTAPGSAIASPTLLATATARLISTPAGDEDGQAGAADAGKR
jgi:hypothetical protein